MGLTTIITRIIAILKQILDSIQPSILIRHYHPTEAIIVAEQCINNNTGKAKL